MSSAVGRAASAVSRPSWATIGWSLMASHSVIDVVEKRLWVSASAPKLSHLKSLVRHPKYIGPLDPPRP
jgi:hypothetical protein